MSRRSRADSVKCSVAEERHDEESEWQAQWISWKVPLSGSLTTIYTNIGLLASSAHTQPSFFADPMPHLDTDTRASPLQVTCVTYGRGAASATAPSSRQRREGISRREETPRMRGSGFRRNHRADYREFPQTVTDSVIYRGMYRSCDFIG
jgi:hypothetical protein